MSLRLTVSMLFEVGNSCIRDSWTGEETNLMLLEALLSLGPGGVRLAGRPDNLLVSTTSGARGVLRAGGLMERLRVLMLL